MQTSSLDSLIGTLVQAIDRDAAALRLALQAMARQAQAEHLDRIRRSALAGLGRDADGGRQQGPQQACG